MEKGWVQGRKTVAIAGWLRGMMGKGEEVKREQREGEEEEGKPGGGLREESKRGGK